MNTTRNYVCNPDKHGNRKTVIIPGLFDADRERMSYDNSKTGFPSAGNTLAGDMRTPYSGKIPHDMPADLCACAGTCPGDCPGCYAKNATRVPEVFIKYALNTIEKREDMGQFYELTAAEIRRGLMSGKIAGAYVPGLGMTAIIRINDSGELLPGEVPFLFRLCEQFPDVRFYLYTKSPEAHDAYMRGEFPANLVPHCSPWIDGETVLCPPVGDMPQFIYDDGSRAEYDALPHCPAVDVYGRRTGVTCRECKACALDKPGARRCVYAHGNDVTAPIVNIEARKAREQEAAD